MKQLFEMPELLTLDGLQVTGLSPVPCGNPNGCGAGCQNGCNGGCSGGGNGNKPSL